MTDEMLQQLFRTAAEGYDGPVDGDGLRAVFEAGRSGDTIPAGAESLAQRFHETYERLAPEFGYKTREASAVPWADVPEANKRLMIAVCAEIHRDTIPVPRELTDDEYAQAIADPGSVVGYRDWDNDETITRWGVRAIRALLARTKETTTDA